MKKKYILSLLMMLVLSLGLSRVCEAKKGLLGNTFRSVKILYAESVTDVYVDLRLKATIATPLNVYYAEYKPARVGIGGYAELVSWTGPGPAPTAQVADLWLTNNSECPGLDTQHFRCAVIVYNITVDQDDAGCPWVARVNHFSHGYGLQKFAGGEWTYDAPAARESICPEVPIATYDISWDPNVVQHDKVLTLTPTGGTIEQTLPTYLMESGKLCDGSQSDSRSAYCRFVATGVTLTVLGCDNNIVTTTAVSYPITDRRLHDIKVAVNTKNVGSGTVTATCNFQYIIEQL